MNILVVDDEKLLVKGIKFNLENEGYTVDTAHDGETAVEMAREGDYALIILDLMMPKKDGVAATAEIHAKLPDTRIVVLTSYSTSDTIAAALAAGAAGAIMKSADDSTLLTAIRVSH